MKKTVYYRKMALGLSLFAATVLQIAVAGAATRTWNAGSGYWNVASYWTPNGVPRAGDYVYLLSNDSTARTVTYATPYYGEELSGLYINSTGSGPMEFHFGPSTTLLKTKSLTVGSTARGRMVQTAGNLLVNDNFHLGLGSGANGSYDLSGGTLDTYTGHAFFYVGYSGTGTFNHSGGTFNGYNLRIARYSSASGTYNLSGDADLSSPIIHIGESGTGTFNQSGGTMSSAFFYLGSSGTGTFNQTGGTSSVSTSLNIGHFEGSSGEYNLSGYSTSLDVTNEFIGNYGYGVFTQTSGTHNVGGTLTIKANSTASGRYNMKDGTLNAANIVNNGSFYHSLGTVGGGLFTNNGYYSFTGGYLNSRLVNQGSLNVTSTVFIHNNADNNSAHENHGTITINGDSQAWFYDDDGGDDALHNYGSINVHGRLGGEKITNYGTVAFYGGSLLWYGTGSKFTNYGTLRQNSGVMNLDRPVDNYGLISLLNGQTAMVTATLNNKGRLDMNGAVVAGSSTLMNDRTGTIAGGGAITTIFTNNGRLLIEDNNLTISNNFASSGMIELTSPAAALNGGVITNSGTIHGRGMVGNDITNSGSIEAIDGTLTLASSVINNSGATMAAGAGAKLVARSGMSANEGLISLTSGTFDSNSYAITNNSRISGYGTVRTGGLTNNGKVLLAGGSSTIDGTVANSSTGTIEVAYGHAIFNDAVTNNGLFKTTEASVSFAANFTNNGTYFSDPSTQTFTDLVVGRDGALVGREEGDIFRVSGNFFNYSANNEDWNTIMAGLEFVIGTGGTNHVMSLAAADLGASRAAYHDNFAWGLLDIDGNSLNLFDGNSEDGGAFYVGSLLGLDIDVDQQLVTNILGLEDLNMYYLAGLADNSYLNGLDYDLMNGGRLIAVSGDTMPTPIPGAIWLLGSGLAGLFVQRRLKSKEA